MTPVVAVNVAPLIASRLASSTSDAAMGMASSKPSTAMTPKMVSAGRVDAQVAELVRCVEPREHGGEHDAGSLAQRRAGDHERHIRGEPFAGQP